MKIKLIYKVNIEVLVFLQYFDPQCLYSRSLLEEAKLTNEIISSNTRNYRWPYGFDNPHMRNCITTSDVKAVSFLPLQLPHIALLLPRPHFFIFFFLTQLCPQKLILVARLFYFSPNKQQTSA